MTTCNMCDKDRAPFDKIHSLTYENFFRVEAESTIFHNLSDLNYSGCKLMFQEYVGYNYIECIKND